jgi:hypothetical protein
MSSLQGKNLFTLFRRWLDLQKKHSYVYYYSYNIFIFIIELRVFDDSSQYFFPTTSGHYHFRLSFLLATFLTISLAC